MGTTGENHIEEICFTHIGTEFFTKVKESYEMERNCHILFQLIMKDCKYLSLSSKPDEVGKKAADEGRFHLLDGTLHHRTKSTCVKSLTDGALINTILHECHDSIVSEHRPEYSTLERAKALPWWPNWRKDVSEFWQACDRCQNANRATVKKFEVMIQIQEPKYPW
ncbi:hypothetical protein O181_091505 [Austropuccinia psidii MF-1]|uniref:Integrase zinc-binding domain-containing protein n=1 Tax=Austropuccinia psidii MF-1 TaxID=1389203 RepID=A0A9Q3IWX1_9BASI|nr:hypothetical protein [Austropuccinia psidii MF-1]